MTSSATGEQQPLLRELIRIPDRLHKGNFVLKLTEGVDKRAATLASYVVTPQLKVAFDEALGLIGSALAENSSKASYLHGSFGSGKSHFMAVLHALLSRDLNALDHPDLTGVVGRHDWLPNRRLLLVPYHITGSETLEAGILGGYADYIRRTEPNAPLPVVYRAQGLLDDARRLRDQFGTEQFLSKLSIRAGEPDNGDWGDLDTTWTVQELDEALASDPESELAQRLLGDVIPVFMPSYARSIAGAAAAFVPLDQGLVAISRHAKQLGYDGIVLFLDELVLWLAGRVGNRDFIARETEKVAKLVESADAGRAVPIVSFIARQRDLRELGIGAERTGAELLSFHDHLQYWDGRIGQITLEDRNLPLIAQKRVLDPLPGKRETIKRAFERTGWLAGGVRDVLLGAGDSDAFERTYPFSPAFMDTLVKASNALQRERTALLLMQQILVNRRDELRLGDLVPLGDLFDAIADGGDQPFTDKLKHEFDQARRLYRQTLRPMLLRDRGVTEDQVAGAVPAERGPLVAFRGDDRLIKTLLLGALIPDVASLRDLTARRLAALNHGSVKTPIPGQEISEVARRLRNWASRVAELQVGEGADPTARLDLVSVNINAILENASGADNPAERRGLVRQLLFDELKVSDTGTTPIDHVVPWRGSRRVVEIVYGNVRDTQELRDDAFEPMQSGRWRVIVDYPFDADQLSAAADRNRMLKLRDQLGKPYWTVAWLPAFFTSDVLDKVSRLVRVNYLLSRNNLEEAARNYGPDDRQRARDLLGNLKGSLRSEIVEALKNAYGLVARPKEDLVQDWNDHLVSMDSGITPRLDAGRSFAEALSGLVDQLYSYSFRKHPMLDAHNKGDVVRNADLNTTLAVVREAADAPDRRVDLDRSQREAIRRIAHPLRIGADHGGPFTLDHEWEGELDRLAAHEPAGQDISVRTVRGWLAEYGMEARVENLLIATYAELSKRSWVRDREVALAPDTVEKVNDNLFLRRQSMPSVDDWELARSRAGALLGMVTKADVVSPRSVARFADMFTTKAAPLRLPAVELVDVLKVHADRLGLDISATAGRYVTAVVASRLLTELHGITDPTALVNALAQTDLGGVEPVVLSRSLTTAGEVLSALRKADWTVLEKLRDPRAAGVREALVRSANANEQAISLQRALDDAKRELLRIFLVEPVLPVAPPTTPPQPSKSVRTARGDLGQVLDAIREFADDNPGVQLQVDIRVVETSDDSR